MKSGDSLNHQNKLNLLYLYKEMKALQQTWRNHRNRFIDLSCTQNYSKIKKEHMHLALFIHRYAKSSYKNSSFFSSNNSDL